MKYRILKNEVRSRLVKGSIEGDFWFASPKLAAPFITKGAIVFEVEKPVEKRRRKPKTEAAAVEITEE